MRLPENRQIPVFVIESDGLIIKRMKKKRKETHRVQVSEGVERNGKRTELVRPRFFSSLKSSTDVWEQLGTYLSATYDLSGTIIFYPIQMEILAMPLTTVTKPSACVGNTSTSLTAIMSMRKSKAA